MPASPRVTAEINAMLPADLLVGIATSTGVAMFVKVTGIWDKLTKRQKDEIEALDKEAPEGAWEQIQVTAPAAVMSGKKFRWKHGKVTEYESGWSLGVDGDEYVVRSPRFDDEDQLV